MNPDEVKEEVKPEQEVGEKVFVDLHNLSDEQLKQLAFRFSISLRFRKTRREMITKLKKHGPFYYIKKAEAAQ